MIPIAVVWCGCLRVRVWVSKSERCFISIDGSCDMCVVHLLWSIVWCQEGDLVGCDGEREG